MEQAKGLIRLLSEYGASDYYPFHMPGHKRQVTNSFASEFPNPYAIDITEINGFDNLHHPSGILKDSMNWAAGIYHADRTYYLINGSSSGVLSAIHGTTSHGSTILMGRNCHKSAYHGVLLNRLKAVYAYPQVMIEYGIQGGLLIDELEEKLCTNKDIRAVLVVSPTYDGIVSDIKSISELVHKYEIPLIVDEAHGAHFPFGDQFPVSALELGADVVIQSLHKTLPAFTQTAIMHVQKGYVDLAKIDRYVHMFQSSSPSYILMAGIENCIRWMDGVGREKMADYDRCLKNARNSLMKMKRLKLLTNDLKGNYGVYDLDCSKIIISTVNTGMDGSQLNDLLRNKYHLEMEMCGADYVTAISSIADTEAGINRLVQALLEIDDTFCLESCGEVKSVVEKGLKHFAFCGKPQIAMKIAEAMDAPACKVALGDSVGYISTEFLEVYPPGIPIIVPGEILSQNVVDLILNYKKLGLNLQGLEDECVNSIMVVDHKGII